MDIFGIMLYRPGVLYAEKLLIAQSVLSWVITDLVVSHNRQHSVKIDPK